MNELAHQGHTVECEADLRRDNDNHTFVIAEGIGKGLGKIKNQRRSWRKLKRMLSAPSVDSAITYAQYEALDQDEKLEKKRAPGSWTPSRYKSNRRAIADPTTSILTIFWGEPTLNPPFHT